MRERVLRDFFENKATIAELARDVAGSISQKSPKISVVSIEDMDGEFTVTAPMLVRLCDVVLGGELEPEALMPEMSLLPPREYDQSICGL